MFLKTQNLPRFLAVFAVVTTALCLGCGRTGSQIRYDGGTGQDGALDAEVDAEVDTDGPLVCRDGELRCNGRTIEVCSSETWVLLQTCDFGCSTAGGPHCGDPVFSNEIHITDFQNLTTPLNLQPGVVVIDTDDGSITGPGAPAMGTYPSRVINRAGMLPDIIVLSFTEINIPDTTEVRVVGSRILALASSGSITLNGLLDVGVQADGSPGPGGYPGGADGAAGDGTGGGGAGQAGSLGFDEGGGGGGGFADFGGNGGAGAQALGGAGGGVYGNPQLDPIAGGSGGGSGASGTAANPGAGGSGGGAVILASLATIAIGPSGGIDAGGGGGTGGGLVDAGGGGGSGGAVLLAAQVVDIYGIVAANGGGGGGSDNMTPEDGQDGLLGNQAAAGGGTGGAGGANDTLSGTAGTDHAHHGPGGGGATGRIRIESVDGPILDGVVSPAETTTGFSMAPMQVQ